MLGLDENIDLFLDGIKPFALKRKGAGESCDECGPFHRLILNNILVLCTHSSSSEEQFGYRFSWTRHQLPLNPELKMLLTFMKMSSWSGPDLYPPWFYFCCVLVAWIPFTTGSVWVWTFYSFSYGPFGRECLLVKVSWKLRSMIVSFLSDSWPKMLL